MLMANSPSPTRPRIGIMSGEVQNNVLYMKGQWSVHYNEQGLVNMSIVADLWPFRRTEDDSVGISGRFTVYDQDMNEYQQGQVELKRCTLEEMSKEEIISLFASPYKQEKL